MRVKCGTKVVALPPMGGFHGAWIKMSPLTAWAMKQILIEDMEQFMADHKDMTGPPEFYALREGLTEMVIYPVPMEDFEIKIRYYPPLVEA